MKNKERLKNFIFYLICCGIVEILMVFLFLICSFQDPSIWIIFLWEQFVIPIIGFVLWCIVQGINYADKQKQAQEEWYQKVNEAVKIIEKMQKEKNDENTEKNS